MGCGCDGTKCGLEPGDRRHGTANGYATQGCRCDACREAQRERKKAYYEANPEAVRERDKAYREANREAERERKKAYCEANPEAVRERERVYREANREAQREYRKAYREANPDVVRARNARRRARKAGALIGPTFTRQQVWDRDNGICHICKQPADPSSWHMDHVVPLVREGAHSFDNCAVSCPPCNLRKGTRLLDELDAPAIVDAVSN